MTVHTSYKTQFYFNMSILIALTNVKMLWEKYASAMVKRTKITDMYMQFSGIVYWIPNEFPVAQDTGQAQRLDRISLHFEFGARVSVINLSINSINCNKWMSKVSSIKLFIDGKLLSHSLNNKWEQQMCALRTHVLYTRGKIWNKNPQHAVMIYLELKMSIKFITAFHLARLKNYYIFNHREMLLPLWKLNYNLYYCAAAPKMLHYALS